MQSARETEAARTRAKELAAACRGRARAVLASADGLTCGITIAQHGNANYNGTYHAVAERDGWPVLQNEHGMWLYRPSVKGQSIRWFLWSEHTPDVDQCSAYIDAPDGSFPIGEQSWKVWDADIEGFSAGTLTMRTLVRSPCLLILDF